MVDRRHQEAFVRQTAHEMANRPMAEVVIETGIFVIIASAALLGNCSVLYVFLKSPALRTVTNCYVVALAISDAALTLVVMPSIIATLAYGHDIIGYQAGQVIGFINISLAYVSLQTTHLIAINRYFCIVKPKFYKRHFKTRPVIVSIIVGWVFSALVNGVLYWNGIITFAFRPGMASYFPTSYDRDIERAIAGISILMFVAMPLKVTMFSYWKIYREVRGHNASVSSTIGNSSSLSKQEIKISICALSLVCSFALCWIPSTTVVFLNTYLNLPRAAELITIYAVALSAAVNPVLFNIFNKRFKAESVKIFCPKYSNSLAVTGSDALPGSPGGRCAGYEQGHLIHQRAQNGRQMRKISIPFVIGPT